jgi:chemotaxis protein MotB
MAGKGGGAWKVAYADFVTAMMAFFMVMWLTAQKPEVKQAVAGYFRDPYAIFLGSDDGSGGEGLPSPDAKLGHSAPSQRRRVPNSGDDANYQFAVLFADGSAELEAVEREKIRSFAPTMVGKLNRVEIRAHSQRKPLPEGSPFDDGWDLCYARAHAVLEELMALGIEQYRVRLSEAESNEPLAVGLTEDELKLNSRVDVILLPDLADAPWRQPHGADEQTTATDPPSHDPDEGEPTAGSNEPPTADAETPDAANHAH